MYNIALYGHGSYGRKCKATNIDDFLKKFSKFLEVKQYGFFVRKSYISNDCYFDIKPRNNEEVLKYVKLYIENHINGNLNYFLLPAGLYNLRDECTFEFEFNSEPIRNRFKILNYLQYNNGDNIHPYLTKEENFNIKYVLHSKVYNNPNLNEETINKTKQLIKIKAMREGFEKETTYFKNLLTLINLKTDN